MIEYINIALFYVSKVSEYFIHLKVILIQPSSLWLYKTYSLHSLHSQSGHALTKKKKKTANIVQWTSPSPLKIHTASSNKRQERLKKYWSHKHTRTQVLMYFSIERQSGLGGLRGQLYLPQQGLSRGRRRVTILALRRLLGHLLINVPGRHPEPQHGRQRRVVQHNPDLIQSERRHIKLSIQLFWTLYSMFMWKNVRLDYIPVSQRKYVQEKQPVLSQTHHQCHSKGVSTDVFLYDLTALSSPSLKDNNTRTERQVQKVLLNHQGCLG